MKVDQIRYIYAPFYSTITCETILKFGSQSDRFIQHLPTKTEWTRLPRQYLLNLATTVLGKVFEKFISEQVEARNAKVAQDQHLLVDLDADVYQAFMNSTHISSKLALIRTSVIMS